MRYDVLDHLLIRLFAFIRYWRAIGVQLESTSAIHILLRKSGIQLAGKNCTLFS
jgi:hypothetical protein